MKNSDKKTNDKVAPREFWIEQRAYGTYQCWDRKQDGMIHVREVLPDEPDWRAIADELAEALKSAQGWVVTHAMQTYSRVADKEAYSINELLAKYESAVSDE